METPLIEFKNVTKRFGSRTILDQVNLKIYEGQISTIIGKSGTGKTELGRMYYNNNIGAWKPLV